MPRYWLIPILTVISLFSARALSAGLQTFSMIVPTSAAAKMVKELKYCGLSSPHTEKVEGGKSRLIAFFAPSIDYAKLDCALRATHPDAHKGSGSVVFEQNR